MATISLSRGLDLPIAGAASGAPVPLDLPATVGLLPPEFVGFVPRMAVQEGDAVQRGTPLLFHKSNPDLLLLSPVAGRVKEVRRGARRVITEVIIEVGGDGAVSHRQWTPAELSKIPRDEATTGLLRSGFWPHLTTRPLDKIADPARPAQAILVSGTETGPLQPGADVLIPADGKTALQAGLYVLKALIDGPVYVTTPAGSRHPAFQGLEGVSTSEFSGPHPSGDPAVQVNHLCPPTGASGVVWTIRAWDVWLIGRFFLEGSYPGDRVYAAVGLGVKQPRFVSTVQGAPIAHILGAISDGVRIIRGSVLTGESVSSDAYTSYYRRGVHVLPEAVERKVLGWAMPDLGTFSVYAAYVKGLLGSKTPADVRPGVYGGHRAMIPIGQYERVIASPDILPDPLFRSMIAGDIEEATKLGLLELSPEEAALCTYICPSKNEFQILLRESLAAYEKEN